MPNSVDIVVAVYNGKRTIERCIDSLLQSNHPDFRVVVVDDCSTDGTPRILHNYGVQIEVQANARNQGVSASRNKAIFASKAGFIAMTDADCRVDPGWLEKAMPHFADPAVGAVTGWLHYEVTNAVSAIREAEYYVRYAGRTDAATVSCPVVVFRRTVLLEVGAFETAFKVGGEDTDLGYKISEKGHRIVYEPGMLVYHEPEARMPMYLKRNYRNAYNHIVMALGREKRNLMRDSFFSPTVRLQPFATLALLCAGIVLPFWGWFPAAVLAAPALTIWLLNFAPITRKACDFLPWTNIPAFVVILTLRNLTWVYAAIRWVLQDGWRSFHRTNRAT